MPTVQPDKRTAQRRELDETIAAGPRLPQPELTADAIPMPLEFHLPRKAKPALEAEDEESSPAPAGADRNSTHLAGEYFVAAELYRRGYSVAMTLGNAKAIDLFAERDFRTVNVQVKAIRDKKNVGWPIMRDRIKDNIIYVFVCLNDPGVSPDFYLCTSSEARQKVRQYKTRGIIQLTSLKSDDYFGRWEKIESALKS